MTREEEIRNEAKLKCRDIAGEVDYKFLAAYDGFVMGAEWADEHPKEGLVSIDKAYKWIKENFENYVGVDVSEYDIYDDEFADDFRKAME